MQRKSYLKICKLFIDNVKDKHPVSDRGETPKDIAKKNGDVEILTEYVRKLKYNKDME